MNFAQLKYFLAVAREEKFSTAAESSYVSQSSLSKQIKSLEEELGVDLFVRSAKGAALTPAGEVFHEFATKTYRRYEDVLVRLEQYADTAHLHIRIGALPLVSDYGLHADLAAFQVENMGIQIDFVERSQQEIVRRLELDRLDLAILRTTCYPPRSTSGSTSYVTRSASSAPYDTASRIVRPSVPSSCVTSGSCCLTNSQP